MKNKLFQSLKVGILAVAIGVGTGYVLANWTPPPAAAPTCPASEPGCNTPINVSGSEQLKHGSLGLGALAVFGQSFFHQQALFGGPAVFNGLADFNGEANFGGWVTVGAGNAGDGEGGQVVLEGAPNTASVTLDNNNGDFRALLGSGKYMRVLGKLQIQDGTEGAGKVLTSDARGQASWAPISTTGGPGEPGGSEIAGKGCGTNQYLSGFDASGNPICKTLFSISSYRLQRNGQTGTIKQDIGSHAYCALWNVQFSVPADKWGNPMCWVAVNGVAKTWELISGDGGNGVVSANCGAICLDLN